MAEAALGLPPAPDALVPRVAKLADAVSLDWMRRFRLDLTSKA